jgi:hypothetical protein
MPIGLAVSDVVNVSVSLEPLAVPTRNFGALCIIGSSNVIGTGERVRQYTSLTGVATDFGTSAPEYLAADLFFSQSPQPSILYIGRWAYTGTNGELIGGVISPTQQTTLLSTLQGITTGGMTITVDGTSHTLSNLNFSSISNLNGAATVLQTAMAAYATVTWNANTGQFIVASLSSGTTSNVTDATDPGSGATLATDLGLTTAAGGVSTAGIAAETPLAAVQAIVPMNSDIYGIMFAAGTGGNITDSQYLAVAAYIEGASPSHMFGITVQEAGVLNAGSTTDLGYLLAQAKYNRTYYQYSSSSPYAVASFFGRAFTTDFTANNTMITMKFKTEPGVTAESLTETQAAALAGKNGNVFVDYMNGAAIIQQGVMASGIYFDEQYGLDWLQNQVQTDAFNLLYTSPTKIPQTDAGVHQIATTVEASMARSVNNGLVAPGVWNSSFTFGTLNTGQALTKGYYVYAPPIASQSQSDRAARKAPTIQVAAKLAGAVHFANVAISVDR